MISTCGSNGFGELHTHIVVAHLCDSFPQHHHSIVGVLKLVKKTLASQQQVSHAGELEFLRPIYRDWEARF